MDHHSTRNNQMYNFDKDDIREINKKLGNMSTGEFGFNDYIPTNISMKLESTES